jgi:hypothetical protein
MTSELMSCRRTQAAVLIENWLPLAGKIRLTITCHGGEWNTPSSGCTYPFDSRLPCLIAVTVPVPCLQLLCLQDWFRDHVTAVSPSILKPRFLLAHYSRVWIMASHREDKLVLHSLLAGLSIMFRGRSWMFMRIATMPTRLQKQMHATVFHLSSEYPSEQTHVCKHISIAHGVWSSSVPYFSICTEY